MRSHSFTEHIPQLADYRGYSELGAGGLLDLTMWANLPGLSYFFFFAGEFYDFRECIGKPSFVA